MEKTPLEVSRLIQIDISRVFGMSDAILSDYLRQEVTDGADVPAGRDAMLSLAVCFIVEDHLHG